MMCPEWALLGTVSTRPAVLWRRCERGERGPILAPGVRGKATTVPDRRPMPAISSVPCVETWWGLALHLLAGVQLTDVMRALVACALAPGAGAVAVPGAV